MPELSPKNRMRWPGLIGFPHDRRRQSAPARQGRAKTAGGNRGSDSAVRLRRAAGHQQFLVPARRLAPGRAGADRRPRSAIAAIAITDRNSFAGIVRAHQAAKEVGIRLVVGCRLDLRDGTSLLAYPDGPRRLWPADAAADPRQAPRAQGRMPSRLRRCRRAWRGAGRRRAAAGGADAQPRAHRAAPPVAADFAGRAYLAAHHLYRGDDARRLARLARDRGERPGCRSSRPTTCSTTRPSGARCRTC